MSKDNSDAVSRASRPVPAVYRRPNPGTLAGGVSAGPAAYEAGSVDYCGECGVPTTLCGGHATVEKPGSPASTRPARGGSGFGWK